MADLVEYEFEDDVWPGGREAEGLNLWCTPCGVAHQLALTDVERIIYAQAAMLSEAGGLYPIEAHGRGCLLEVLATANTGQLYLEQVAEAVANREQAGPAGPAPVEFLNVATGKVEAAPADQVKLGALLPVASPGDLQVLAAGGRVQTRVVGEGPPTGWTGSPEARAIVASAGVEQAISEPGQRIAEGAALDAERAGRPAHDHCPHNTIWYDDEDDVTRCAACHGPIRPALTRRSAR